MGFSEAEFNELLDSQFNAFVEHARELKENVANFHNEHCDLEVDKEECLAHFELAFMTHLSIRIKAYKQEEKLNEKNPSRARPEAN
jgi:hypothetical protein